MPHFHVTLYLSLLSYVARNPSPLSYCLYLRYLLLDLHLHDILYRPEIRHGLHGTLPRIIDMYQT